MTRKIIVLIIIIVVIISYYYIQKNIYQSSEIVNNWLDYFCTDPPVFNPVNFQWTQMFRDNWKAIRNEYLVYATQNDIPFHSQINQYVAGCDEDNGWQTLYLRAYGVDTELTKYFPLTTKLINLCPCTLAYFSVLKPGATLQPHIGIYKGVIRYHLGLIVPDDWQNCFLQIDCQKLFWQEGSDLMFDDMFVHHVENNTNQTRVVLFLDIKRDFHNIFINGLNTLFLRFIKSNDALTDTINNVNLFGKI